MSSAHHASSRRPSSLRRVVMPAVIAIALLGAGAGLVVWSLSPDRALGQLEHEETSAFSRIRVRRDGNMRVLTFVRDNGQEFVQSRIDLTAPQTLASPYARSMFASYLYQPHPRRVLIVGLGGGAMVRFLAHHEPRLLIDAVEIDPAVVRIASDYFGVRGGGQVRIETTDAFAFIESTTDRYDMILMDAFLRPSDATDATGVPRRLKTVQFLGRVKRTLAPGGVVAFNVNEHDQMAEDIAAVDAAFGSAAVFGSPGAENKVVIATVDAMPADDALRAQVGALDARFAGALSFGDVLGHRQ